MLEDRTDFYAFYVMVKQVTMSPQDMVFLFQQITRDLKSKLDYSCCFIFCCFYNVYLPSLCTDYKKLFTGNASREDLSILGS